MYITASQHPSEEMIEQYAMGKLDESSIDFVEEHLLICHHCQDYLKTTDEFIHAMRMSGQSSVRQPATATVPGSTSARSEKPAKLLPSLPSLPAFWPPKAFQPLLSAACLTLAAVSIAVWAPKPGAVGASVQELRLEAMRGDTSSSESALAGRRLRLTLAAPGVKDGEYVVEIADATGKVQRTTAAHAADGEVSFETTKPLETGQYWVRLSHDKAGLLREFSLPVR